MTYETFVDEKVAAFPNYYLREKILGQKSNAEGILANLKSNIETIQATQDYTDNADQTEIDFFNGLISKIDSFLA